ncbi:polysaccharide deacetylase family protein [Halomonas denitrificans]|nr:polysaccharide deacetylase family protein [Halomonas denitrificans]
MTGCDSTRPSTLQRGAASRWGGFLAAPALALLFSAIGDAHADQRPPADHAVVLLYHHVADDTPASTSVTPERFEAHLDWLADEGYAVRPLLDLLEALSKGEAVPERSVAITFDDAWVSVHDTAAPMLAERGWPYTVFVNTDAVDAGEGPVMSWDQLRALAEAGASLESHSASHAHLAGPRDGETRADWTERIDADLARAARRLEEETGRSPRAFAYPYGEDSRALARRVARHHEFGLVQRSGAVGAGTDLLAVPRFPFATGFDGLDRLERAVRSRPLPVSAAEPHPPGDGPREPLERLVLSIDEGAYRVDAVACYGSSGTTLAVEALDPGPPLRLAIDVSGIDSAGRNKVNCTAPAADGSGDWFWYAYQWLRPPLE